MNSKLIVDYREKRIIDKLKASQKIIDILEVRNLDIADIIVQYDKYSFYIERKSVPDLVSSIKDGRYKEQKIRLQSQIHKDPSSQIMYIIEGINKFRNHNEENIYYGSWISTTLRDRIPVFRTSNMDETVSLIIRLLMRLQKDATQFFNNNLNDSLTSTESNNLNESINSNINQYHSLDKNSTNINENNDINITNNDTNNNNNNDNNNNQQYKIINLDTSKGKGKKNKNNEQNIINQQFEEQNNVEQTNVQQTNIQQTNIEQHNTKVISNNTNDNVNLEYLSTIKTKKKNNITPSNWELIALSNIPGISVAIANEVFKEYKNIGCLYQKYNSINDETEKEKLLCNIELTTKTGKTRKLGLVASKKIYQYVFKHN
jgi:ERCC4-type nuclease